MNKLVVSIKKWTKLNQIGFTNDKMKEKNMINVFLVLGHFIEGHFIVGHFIEGHFIGHFIERHFIEGHLIEGHFIDIECFS